MNAKARRYSVVCVPLAMLAPLVSNSCASKPGSGGAGSAVEVLAGVSGDLELTALGVRARFSPRIDRLVFFGPDVPGGQSLLHTRDLDKSPPESGEYTFFGGAYSWWAPQNGPKGWVGADGSLKNWPPDPKMDVGPSVFTSRSSRSISVVGPVQRSGLREVKSFKIVGPNTAEFSYTLENITDRVVTAGPWLNTAVEPASAEWGESVMAFKLWEGPVGGVHPPNDMWDGMGDNAAERLSAALLPAAKNGWAALPLSRAAWNDGIKVYLSPQRARGEIAVWREGWWLHRRLTTGDAVTHARLRELGEGPVAAYINPGLGIIEAELVAPIVDIPPGGSTTAVERWTLIECATPDVGVLPR